MTDSTSVKHSASFSSTRSITEIRSSYWMGFLSLHDTIGRAVGEEDDPTRGPKIGSIDMEDGAIDVGLSCTS